MRYIILALFLAGCADALDSDAPPTQWAVTVNAGDSPAVWSCAGAMNLTIATHADAPTSVDGTWECGDVGGLVSHGTIAHNATIAFDLETKPGEVTRFVGVMDGMKFSGHAVIHGGELPLIATPR